MKICEFIGSLSPGGAENFVKELSICARKHGNEVTVLLLWEPDFHNEYFGSIYKVLKDNGIAVESLHLRKEFMHSLKLFWRALRFFRSHDFDVVHSHCDREDILNVMCRIICWKKYLSISTLHNTVLPTGGWSAKLNHWCHSHCLKSVFCGREAWLANRDRYPKSTFIENGISLEVIKKDIAHRATLPHAEPRLLAVGRLTPQKNQSLLIEAIKLATAELPKLKLFICGEGILKEDLTRQIAAEGLEEHVVLLGARSDVPDLLDQADYFVSTSIYEGLPIAVLEAATHHVPALLSPIKPHVALAHRIRGCRVATDDSPQAMAELIVSSTKQQFRQQMSDRIWAEDLEPYSMERCWEKYYSLFCGKLQPGDTEF